MQVCKENMNILDILVLKHNFCGFVRPNILFFLTKSTSVQVLKKNIRKFHTFQEVEGERGPDRKSELSHFFPLRNSMTDL